ncbi:anti-sigma factor [Alteriqipengyuania sp. 357]
MTGPDDTTPELTVDERLAAEYAMGLLEGEDLLEARGRLSCEPQLAGMVARWEQRLAPMLDDVGGATPSPDLWERIAGEMEQESEAASPIVLLQRRVTFWQRIAAGSAVAAVAAIALLALDPATGPSPAPGVAPDASAPLVASIPLADTALRIGVTFLPEREELLVAADGLSADGVHDHELWLIPAEDGAELQSLGLIAPGEQRRVPLDPALAALIHDGSRMVLTREPLGGKPPAEPAGPVVAEGAFDAI